MAPAIALTCSKPGCNGRAIPRTQLIRRENGKEEWHFDCPRGHTFHSDATMGDRLPCDCQMQQLTG
jgi:hypothetical protein